MSLLLELRAATRDVHARAEERLDVLHRCRDRHAYVQLIQGLHSVYAPLEDAVQACPATVATVPDWAERRKTPWLDEDLAALGVAPAPPSAAPAVRRAEDVVGTVYVMEGATLGGAVVLRSLTALPVPPPHRFFTAYAVRRQEMWRSFRQHVARLEVTALDRGIVVDAATRTFEAVLRSCPPAVR